MLVTRLRISDVASRARLSGPLLNGRVPSGKVVLWLAYELACFYASLQADCRREMGGGEDWGSIMRILQYPGALNPSPCGSFPCGQPAPLKSKDKSFAAHLLAPKPTSCILKELEAGNPYLHEKALSPSTSRGFLLGAQDPLKWLPLRRAPLFRLLSNPLTLHTFEPWTKTLTFNLKD